MPNELTSDGHGIVEKAAWVIAEIEHECCQPAGCLSFQRPDSLFQCGIHGTDELGDPHIPYIVGFQPLLDYLDMENLPPHHKDQGVVHACALDCQCDLCVG